MVDGCREGGGGFGDGWMVGLEMDVEGSHVGVGARELAVVGALRERGMRVVGEWALDGWI